MDNPSQKLFEGFQCTVLSLSYSSLKMSDCRAQDCDLGYSSVKFTANSGSEYTELNKNTANPASTYTALAKTAAGTRSPEKSSPEECTIIQNSKNEDNNDNLSTRYNIRKKINSAAPFNVKRINNIKEFYQRVRKCGVTHLRLIITLLITIAFLVSAVVSIIVAFVEISKLHSEITQLQSTLQMGMIDQNTTEVNRKIIKAIFVDLSRETGYTFPSCAAILKLSPSSSSGYYNIRSSNGSAIIAYCDMTRSCGGITGGWMRVDELDMRDDSSQCPDNLELSTSPRRTCRIENEDDDDSYICSSDIFMVNKLEYSEVCGKIIAYQVGIPDAFAENFIDINTYYVDGIILTHGMSPKQHIWTFAAAGNEDDEDPNLKCPCINTAISSNISMTAPPPPFVGNNYFCDTAAVTGRDRMFYEEDPLWDGEGCGPQNTCCSFNNPPWFYRELPQSTTDDIEMRVCRNEDRDNEDIAIEVVEIYVR